jgi:hypothetical protein
MPFVASAVRAMLASERGRRALQARARNRIQKLQAAGCKSLRAIAAGPGGAPAVFPQHAAANGRLFGYNGCWRRPASFETQVAILIATRADQPVCLLEYTLKSWAAGRALTEKTPPACWTSAVNSPSTVPAASLRGSV